MGLGLVVLGAALVWRWASSPAKAEDVGPVAIATRGELVISITENGEVEAKTSTKIANELHWPVVISQVVPEGTLVKKGDIIITFECQELKDALDRQQLVVTEAESSYTQASERLSLARKQMENKVKRSQEAVIDAESALSQYIEFDAPLAAKNAQSDVQVAQRDLALAQDKLEFKLKVNKDPELNSPYSVNEIKSETLSVERLRLSQEKALAQLDMLSKYEHPRKLRALNMKVADTQLELEKDRLEAKTEIAAMTANERSRKEALDKQKEQLASLLVKQEKLTVRAEQAGLVVYNSGRNRRGDNIIEVGEKVEPNRQLMIVPDMQTLQVRTKVYESMIEQVARGLPALVRLDSKPTLVLNGTVQDVSVLPDSSQWWSPDVKIFSVIVKIEAENHGLKPGMTAQVEMVLARLGSDTLSLPVAALFSEQEENYCWRVRGGVTEKVPVKIGRMSDTRVQILEGLSEGDMIRLSQPPQSRKQPPVDANQPAPTTVPDDTAVSNSSK